MPCNDGGYPGSTRVEYVEHGNQTSRLCAVFTVLEHRGLLQSVLDACDWKEAGVSKASTLDWWARHKEQDYQRRVHEKAEATRKAKKKEILAKLSPEEKKILGV